MVKKQSKKQAPRKLSKSTKVTKNSTKSKLANKKANGVWFAKLRGSYIPCSWQGWLTYVPYVSFLIITFVAVNRHENSASDVLFGIFPYWICAAIVMQWLAGRKS